MHDSNSVFVLKCNTVTCFFAGFFIAVIGICTIFLIANLNRYRKIALDTYDFDKVIISILNFVIISLCFHFKPTPWTHTYVKNNISVT